MSSTDLNAPIKPLMVAEDWPKYVEHVRATEPYFPASGRCCAWVRIKGTDMGIEVSVDTAQSFTEAQQEAEERAKYTLLGEGLRAVRCYLSQQRTEFPVITEIEV